MAAGCLAVRVGWYLHDSTRDTFLVSGSSGFCLLKGRMTSVLVRRIHSMASRRTRRTQLIMMATYKMAALGWLCSSSSRGPDTSLTLSTLLIVMLRWEESWGWNMSSWPMLLITS